MKMSDSIKFEFIKALDEFEELSNIFDNLQAETVKLKEEYQLDPDNEELLNRIKIHEEKYRQVYEQFQALNEKSKEIREASYNESASQGDTDSENN